MSASTTDFPDDLLQHQRAYLTALADLDRLERLRLVADYPPGVAEQETARRTAAEQLQKCPAPGRPRGAGAVRALRRCA